MEAQIGPSLFETSCFGHRCRRHAHLAVLWIGLGLAGCGTVTTPSVRTVPLAWRHTNAWSPEANDLRDQGLLPLKHQTPEMEELAQWARDHLHDGDIVFRLGRGSIIPLFDLSHHLSKISDSQYSHVGVIAFENNKAFIFDTDDPGVRKMPFEVWMLDIYKGRWEVLRPKPEVQKCIPQVLSYIRDKHERQVPFDFWLKLDDEKLYCTEMIEKAFAEAGAPLSEPVAIRDLPNYRLYLPLKPFVTHFTPLDLDEPVYAIGNDSFGMLSSSHLDVIEHSRN